MKVESLGDTNNRSGWIDIIRAIAIFCVVFGHICRNNDAHAFVYSFHLVLFFFVGGLCYKKRGIILDIKKKAYRLLVPYFIWGGISIVYYETMYHVIGKGSSLDEIFWMFTDLIYGDYFRMHYNRVLWFLPCYFCVVTFNNIIVNIFDRISAKKIRTGMGNLTLVALLLTGIIGAIVSCFEILSSTIWGLNRAVIFEPFYVAGMMLSNILKGYEFGTIEKKGLSLAKIVIAISGLFYLMYNPFNENKILNSVYFTGIIGIIVFVIISKLIEKSKLLEKMGRCSIGILSLHAVVYESFVSLLMRIFPIYADEFISAFPCLMTIIMIIISVVIHDFIVERMPIVFGKYKKL